MPFDALVQAQATLADALNEMLRSHVGVAVVVDAAGVYTGTIDMSVIMAAAETMRRSAREASRSELAATEDERSASR